MRQLKSCGVFVVQGQPIDSFLLLLHADRYDIPKGHVDPGENDIQCALRELEEETGIVETDVNLDPEFRFCIAYRVRPRKYHFELCRKSLVVFLGWLKRPVEIRLTEHISYEWHRWDPPHQIQTGTIDQLLQEVSDHVRG